MMHRFLLPVALVSLLTFGCVGCDERRISGPITTEARAAPTIETPADPPALGVATVGSSDIGTEDHPRDDEPLALWVRERFPKIPMGLDLRKITSAELPKMHAFVDATQLAALFHVQNFPESKNRAEVISVLTKLMAINQARFLKAETEKIKAERRVLQEDYRRLIGEYNQPIQKLVQEALALEPTKDVRYRLLQTSGLCFNNTHESKEAADAFEEALATKPDAADADHCLYNLCESLDKGALFERCLNHAAELLRRFPKSEYVPHAIFLMHKAHRHGGLLAKGIEFWQKYTPILEAGAAGEPMTDLVKDEPTYRVPQEHRTNYAIYLNRALFYQGFFSLALGNRDEAIAYLEAYVDQVDKKRAAGTLLDPSVAAYRDHQAVPYLATLYGLIQQPAPSLFDPEGWIIPPDFDTPDASPRSCIVWFCPLGAARYRLFFPLLEAIAEEYAPEGVQLVWVSFPPSSQPEDYPALKDRFLFEAETRHMTCSLVFDMPQGEASPLHEAFGATRGSGDLYIVDAHGEVQWRVIDPMYWDEGLVRAVMKRVFRPEKE